MNESEIEKMKKKRFDENRGKRIRAYGISVEEYDEMFESQNGSCWICRKEEGVKSLCIDHDHETNQVRGLLCITCNKGLGDFQDNIEFLNRAIDYLKKHEMDKIKKQNKKLENLITELFEKVKYLSEEYKDKVFQTIVYTSYADYEQAKAAELFSRAFHASDIKHRGVKYE
jgi:hypothetical protein